MNTALITGASSGIGEAISRMLLSEGFEIYGIGRDFTHISPLLHSDRFHPVICDLSDTRQTAEVVTSIADSHPITHLINNAGIGYFGPHEQLNPKKIHELVTVNLEIPMLLTNLLLRSMKQNGGTIVNISSVTAKKANTYGCAYGATKAGLSSFSESLFEEVRKYGVRVITIHPDMTRSNFYKNADFTEGDTENTYLFPDEIAEVLCTALSFRDGMLVQEITIKPQKHQIKRKETIKK